MVIFDFDGTLLNSEPIHAKAFFEIAQNLGVLEGLTSNEIEEMALRFWGKTDLEIFKSLKKERPETFVDSIHNYLKQKTKIVASLIDSLSEDQLKEHFTQGIFPYLNFLKQKQKHLAIVSAGDKPTMNQIIQKVGLDGYFDLIVGQEDTHFSKPNPSPFFYAFRHFKTSPKKTLIFEDSPTGLTAALGSGAEIIQVCEHSTPKSQSLTSFLDDKKDLIQIDHFLALG